MKMHAVHLDLTGDQLGDEGKLAEARLIVATQGMAYLHSHQEIVIIKSDVVDVVFKRGKKTVHRVEWQAQEA